MDTTDQAALETVKKSAGLLIALGVLEILLGVLAISMPALAGGTVVILVGVVFLVSGLFQLLGALRAGSFGAGLASFLVGLLAVLCGGMLISEPWIGLGVLTLILAITFCLQGLAEIALSFRMRPMPGSGWCLFAGIASLVLGLLMFLKWPLSGLWAVGTLVGIQILFQGWQRVAIGTGVRSAAKTAVTA